MDARPLQLDMCIPVAKRFDTTFFVDNEFERDVRKIAAAKLQAFEWFEDIGGFARMKQRDIAVSAQLDADLPAERRFVRADQSREHVRVGSRWKTNEHGFRLIKPYRRSIDIAEHARKE
ncbi:hypothetical protein [Paraburkholderia sp. RAU2J]|uniref:hypothetical protein n=1 Tax=Paraburkholderia sp. RAU2J TaxID=1938810 RepID=UPI001F5400E3|nr:hypothetical protein [Paraburkholderia sp. RAU2J]